MLNGLRAETLYFVYDSLTVSIVLQVARNDTLLGLSVSDSNLYEKQTFFRTI